MSRYTRPVQDERTYLRCYLYLLYLYALILPLTVEGSVFCNDYAVS